MINDCYANCMSLYLLECSHSRYLFLWQYDYILQGVLCLLTYLNPYFEHTLPQYISLSSLHQYRAFAHDVAQEIE